MTNEERTRAICHRLEDAQNMTRKVLRLLRDCPGILGVPELEIVELDIRAAKDHLARLMVSLKNRPEETKENANTGAVTGAV